MNMSQELREEVCEDLELFEKLEELGSGSFGKVYKVRHYITGNIFALKVLDKNQLRSRN